MIRVTFFHRDDVLSGFISEGHAEWADEGEDIVCAAVSVLTLNTCNSMEELTDDAFTLDAAPDGGYLKLTLDGEVSAAAQLLLESLELGLLSVTQTYGTAFLQIDYQDL